MTFGKNIYNDFINLLLNKTRSFPQLCWSVVLDDLIRCTLEKRIQRHAPFGFKVRIWQQFCFNEFEGKNEFGKSHTVLNCVTRQTIVGTIVGTGQTEGIGQPWFHVLVYNYCRAFKV